MIQSKGITHSSQVSRSSTFHNKSKSTGKTQPKVYHEDEIAAGENTLRESDPMQSKDDSLRLKMESMD